MSEEREILEKLNECADRLQSAEKTVTEVAEKLKAHDTNPMAHRNMSVRKMTSQEDEKLAELQLTMSEIESTLTQGLFRISKLESEIIKLKSEIQLLNNNLG